MLGVLFASALLEKLDHQVYCEQDDYSCDYKYRSKQVVYWLKHGVSYPKQSGNRDKKGCESRYIDKL